MVKKRQQFSLSELLRGFWPLFLLAAVLPVLSFGVSSTAPFSLFTRADAPNSMRVWMEPSTIIAYTNQEVTIHLMAELDKPKSLLPSFSTQIVANDPSIQINTPVVSFMKPFGGRIVVGDITIKPTQPGTYSLMLPKDQIKTGQIYPDTIDTGNATIIVK